MMEIQLSGARRTLRRYEQSRRRLVLYGKTALCGMPSFCLAAAVAYYVDLSMGAVALGLYWTIIGAGVALFRHLDSAGGRG